MSSTSKSDQLAPRSAGQDGGKIVPPAHLTTIGTEGVDELRSDGPSALYLKIIQGSSQREYKDAYGEGTLVAMPDGVIIAEFGEEFEASPVHFHRAFVKMYDINDKSEEAQNVVAGESFDPESDIARRARDKNLREEPYGDGLSYRYCESLNYMLAIESGSGEGVLAMFRFIRGNFVEGDLLRKHLSRMGDAHGVPIYGNRLRLWTGWKPQRGTKNEFAVLRWAPAESPFAHEERTEGLREMYAQARQAFEAARDASNLSAVDSSDK